MDWRRGGTRALAGGGAACALAGLTLALFWLRDPAHDSWGRTRVGTALLLLVVAALLVGAGQVLRLAELRRRRATPATFLTPAEERRVLEAIAAFERRTSGEIRVHLEGHVEGDLLQAARGAFERLGMARTAQRNGVLFYVAVGDRRLAVIGDAGIHERVEPGFWDHVVARVERGLAAGRPAEGLIEGVEAAGTALAEHFPPRAGDVNELPDGLSRG